jgi:hypothetical protein
MSVQSKLSSKDVNYAAHKRHAHIFKPIAPVNTNRAPVAQVMVGILKKIPAPAAKASIPKLTLRSAPRPSLSSTTRASAFQRSNDWWNIRWFVGWWICSSGVSATASACCRFAFPCDHIHESCNPCEYNSPSPFVFLDNLPALAAWGAA